MTDNRKRRVDALERQAARDGDTDADIPVVPDDPTDLPHDAETYFWRAIEHTSLSRDLSADMDGSRGGETASIDPENDVGPYPHAAERYHALKRANGDYPPEGEERSVPKYLADSQLSGAGGDTSDDGD